MRVLESEVNITTGRAGYYRRVDAQEKEVNMEVEVRDGSLELGADVAKKQFEMATKLSIQQQESSIDISDLPFFQRTSSNVSIFMVGSGSGSARASLPTVPSKPMLPDAEPNPSQDSESIDENTSSNVMSQMQNIQNKIEIQTVQSNAI